MTPEFKAELLLKQGNRCAICRTAEPMGHGKWCIDHDHKNGRIRGLLCHSCNVGIGFLADDPERLRRAAEYIERPPLRELNLVKKGATNSIGDIDMLNVGSRVS